MSIAMRTQQMTHRAVAPIIQGTAISSCDVEITTAKTVSGSAAYVIDLALS
jgi:hypothetical protein